jgi:peptidoglycan L-alanyl-D-glutamate endopeptidase CwlK
MPRFGTQSTDNLRQCHADLQRLFEEVVKVFDCKVIWGHRVKEEQNQFYHQGFSKLRWPDSSHNSLPSLGVDVCPYPIDWQDTARFYYFGGYVKGVAERLGIRDLRWGGDWDSDWIVKDQSFNDLAHWELHP